MTQMTFETILSLIRSTWKEVYFFPQTSLPIYILKSAYVLKNVPLILKAFFVFRDSFY